jgi:adenylate cyclase
VSLAALRERIDAAGGAPVTVESEDGGTVIAAKALIAGTNWTLFVEQPLSEAFAPIYAAMRRTVALLVAGSGLAAALAYWLAGRMSGPIRLLHEGTQRIGAGDFAHRIAIETGDELEQLANGFNDMAAGLAVSRERSERITRLRRFLAPQVAELVVSSGSETLLAGQRRVVVAVFCDLRGFTALSAKSPPEVIIGILGAYFAALGAAVTRHEGTVTGYTGDGMMVLFNAPVEIPDPARRAIAMALDMQGAVQALLLQWRAAGHTIGFGMGLAMGEATVGQIGYENKRDYTAVGSAVNLAARLCADAADGQILLDATAAQAVKGLVHCTDLGARSIKGFDQPVATFAVVVAGGMDAIPKGADPCPKHT